MGLKQLNFFIHNVTCSVCINTVKQKLINTPGLSNLIIGKISDERAPASVWMDESLDQSHLRLAIESVGFGFSENLTSQNNTRRHWIFGGIGIVLGLTVLLVMLCAGPLPLAVMISLGVISVLTTLVLSAEFLWAAKSQIQQREPAMDTLFIISTAIVIIVSITAFFIPWLPMMFDVGLLVFGFRHLGLALKETLFAVSGIKKSLQSDAMEFVYTQLDETVLVTDLKPNDLISIKSTGQMIPVDGEYAGDPNNMPSLLKTHITGEILPSKLKPEEKILAGMILQPGSPDMLMRVTSTADESHLAKTDKFIEHAEQTKAVIQTKTEYFLQYYFIPTVLFIACLSAVLLSIFATPAIAIICSISVLVSACPCNLGIITPLAMYVGMKKAQGIRFQHADALEKASTVSDVIFDLNGTLTQGKPWVEHGLENYKDLLCAMETNNPHPVGQAIREYSGLQESSLVCTTLTPEPDGMYATINNSAYILGNSNMMIRHGIVVEPPIGIKLGDSVIYLYQDKENLGYMLVRDPLRTHALETVQALQKNGITVHMCTGADQPTAQAYADQLGITNVFSKSIGTEQNQVTDKLEYVRKLMLEQHKKLLYVGDALNDVRAFSFVRANGGVSMLVQHNHAAQAAAPGLLQCADVLMDAESLLSVPRFLEVSQQTMSNIYLNLLGNLAYNIIMTLLCAGILVAVGIVLHPAIGVIVMSVVFGLMLLSVLAFQRQSLTWVDSTNRSKGNTTGLFDRPWFFNTHTNTTDPGELTADQPSNLLS